MGLIRGILLAVFLFAAFAVVALLMLPKERIARVASTELSQALGRDVEITGELGLSFWPVLGVRTGPVRVAGPDWAPERPLLRASAMSIGLGAAAALKREVDVRRVELIGAELNLIVAKDGRASWSLGDADSNAQNGAQSGAIRPFSIERAELRGGSIRYEDRRSGTAEQIGALDATLTMPQMAGPAALSLRGARSGGRPLALDVEIGHAGDFIAGRLVRSKLSLEAEGGRIGFDGLMTRGLDMDGQLSIKASSTSRFLASLGLGAAEPPKGLGQSAELRAKMIFAGGRVINLRGMDLTLDQNRLTGDADIRLDGPRPKLTAQMRGGALDLAALANEGGSSAESAGWSKAKIDAGGLSAMDAAISLELAALDAGMVKLGPSTLAITLDNARAVFKLLKAEGYGGQIVGQFVMNNRGGLSVGGDLSILQGDTKPLLADLLGVERLSGKADGYIKFLGAGSSLDAIMRSLSGSGGLSMAQGTLSGFDLNLLLGNAANAGGTTVFDKMSASFDIKGGVLRNDNLTMSLPNFTATGKGAVDLGAQRIDYLFTPVALKANKGRDIAFPVRVRGSWADPRVSVDVKAAIDLNFAEKKKEVKTKVEGKIAEELGVSVGEGESLEDAVKKKAEDSLKKKLLKIFE